MSTETVSDKATEDATSTNGQDPLPMDSLGMSRVAIDRELKAILVAVLGVSEEDAADFDDDTGLFGHLPELDSMAVAGLLTEMEDRLNIVIEDDDVDGEMLETYGGLLAFAEAKIIQG